MYDWSEQRLDEYIETNSRNNFLLIEFSYKQLGRSEKWFKKQCRELNYDLFKIKREILLEWTSTSDNCPFTEEQVELINKNVKDKLYSIFIKEKYELRVYKDIDFGKAYLIGIDTATGMTRDYSTIVITDPDNYLEVVADFKNNKIDTVEMASLVYELCTKYMKFGPIIIEKNSVGKSILDMLEKTPLERRLYYEYKNAEAEVTLNNGHIARRKTMTKVYGVSTDTKTRPKMIDLLRNIVIENYEFINSVDIKNEISGLEYQKNGTIGHSSTTHDDLIFAMLMCHYVWTYGKNLASFNIHKLNSLVESKSFRDSYEIKSMNDVEKEFANKINYVSSFNEREHITRSSASDELVSEFVMRSNQERLANAKSNRLLSVLNDMYK